jgi:hypothetical protein
MSEHMRLWPKAGTVSPAFWLNNGGNQECNMAFMTGSTSLRDDGVCKCVTLFSCYLYEDLAPTQPGYWLSPSCTSVSEILEVTITHTCLKEYVYVVSLNTVPSNLFVTRTECSKSTTLKPFSESSCVCNVHLVMTTFMIYLDSPPFFIEKDLYLGDVP